MAFKYGKRSRENLDGVSPDVKALANLALEYSKIDMSIIDGFRTSKQQKKLFDKGLSELDGSNGISDHQTRMAIDFIPYVKGLDIWNVSEPEVAQVWLECYRGWLRAAMKLNLALEFGLGYDINGGRDYPHISVKGRLNA